MKNRFILFQRSGIFYCEDTTSGKQTSLRTRDRDDAKRLLHVKNEAIHQPAMNLQIAQVYLQHGDPALATRTWQDVMTQITVTKTGSTQLRWQVASRDEAFDSIRDRKLIETTSEHFVAVLKAGKVATNVFLRRMHYYAVAMYWLPWPVLGKRHWPKIQFKAKRAVTLDEHQKVIQREPDAIKRAYYELLWYLGGAQTDIASLTAEDIDWQQKTIAYRRCKTGVTSLISFGDEVAGSFEGVARGRLSVSDAGKRSVRTPRQDVCPAGERAWHPWRDVAQLPLCLGRAGERGGLSRTVCDAGAWAFQQGGSPGVREESASCLAPGNRNLIVPPLHSESQVS